MNVVTLLIPHPQASLVEEPIEGRFHHVAILPEPAAVFGVPLGNPGCHSTLTQRRTDFLFGIVGSIRQHLIRALSRPTPALLDGGNRIH